MNIAAEALKLALLALLAMVIAHSAATLAIDTLRGFELPDTTPPAEEENE